MANQSAHPRSPLSFSALATIKAQIRENGSSSNLLALLESDNDDAVLVEVREQKLLLGYSDRQQLMQCLDAFKRRAQRASGVQELQENEAYADFIGRITELRTAAANQARAVIARMPRLGTVELAELTGEYATTWLHQIADTAWAGFTDDLGNKSLSDATRAAVSARAVHEVQGRTNDALFALARALNECFRQANHGRTYKSGRAVREGFLSRFPELLRLASTWMRMTTYAIR